MIPYIIIFILLMLAAIAWEVRPFKTYPLLIFFTIILALFAGLRGPYIDKDYLNYENGITHIEEVNSQTEETIIPFFEPGFYLLSVTAKSLFPNKYVLAIMVFYAIASISMKALGIRLIAVNPFMVLLLYFSQFFLLHEMTQVRIGMATGMFLLGLYCLCHKKKFYFVIIILLATAFHYSCILYLSLLLFDTESFNRKLLLAALGVALLLAIIKLPMLPLIGFLGGEAFVKIDNYVRIVESGQAEQINTLNVLTLITWLIVLILVCFLPVEFLQTNPFAILNLKLLVLSIIVLNAMSSLPTMAFRMSELFSVVTMFAVYYLRYVIPNRIIAVAAMVLVASAQFFITLFYGQLLEPYKIAI